MSCCCNHNGYHLAQIKYQSLIWYIYSGIINIIILDKVERRVVVVFLPPLPAPSDVILPQCYGGDYPLPEIINVNNWCSIQQIHFLPTPPPTSSPLVV